MRCTPMMLGASCGIFLAACDGGYGAGPSRPPALEIEAHTPAPDATSVETGVSVTVVFNQAIDPATLTEETFHVTRGGVQLPAAVTYDAASLTARLIVPLLPGASYEVEVTTDVRTAADSALSVAAIWSFSTRPWEAAVIDPTGTVWTSSLAVEANGRLHVSYMAGADADLWYATCSTSCAAPASWQRIAADAAGLVGDDSSLEVDASGRVHVSYADYTNGDLKYATCATDCGTSAASWQAVTVDAAGSVGESTSLAVDATGRVHVSHYDATNGDLRYATCAADCGASASNWTAVTVDAVGAVGEYTSLAVDGSGRIHIAYLDRTNADLEYATCAANCATVAGWQKRTVDGAGSVGEYAALSVDGTGEFTSRIRTSGTGT